MPCHNLFNLPECIRLAVERDSDDAFEPLLRGSPPAPPTIKEPMQVPATTTSPSPVLRDAPPIRPLKRARSVRLDDVGSDQLPHASATSSAVTSPSLDSTSITSATKSTPPPLVSQTLVMPKLSHNHKKRRMRRDAKIAKEGHAVRPEVVATHVAASTPLPTALDTKELPATGCGYAARRQGLAPEGELFANVEEALEAGYTYVPWKGLAAMPFTGENEKIFAIWVGRPCNDPTWEESCQRAYDAIMREGAQATFSKSETSHRRGDFPALNVGVTMGLGATSPTNLDNGPHAAMVERLLKNRDIQRLAHFADFAFSLWAPNVYAHYISRIGQLFERVTRLRRIFPKSIFPAAAFNFGPNVWTRSHRDLLNFAIGWCAIQALGDFDPTKGGQFVLPDLKLVVEFPPNTLILVPSATLTHANIPVRKGESRVSFTQYCSGGLFRFVDNGFRTEKQLRKEDPEEYERIVKLKNTRWQWGLSLYSSLDDIVSRVSS